MRALGCRLMLVKIVTFFLIGIAVLAMFGRLKFPGQTRLKMQNALNVDVIEWVEAHALVAILAATKAKEWLGYS